MNEDRYVIKWNGVWHGLRPSKVHPRLVEGHLLPELPIFDTRKEALEWLNE
jgi:hypothetical protein